VQKVKPKMISRSQVLRAYCRPDAARERVSAGVSQQLWAAFGSLRLATTQLGPSCERDEAGSCAIQSARDPLRWLAEKRLTIRAQRGRRLDHT